MSDEKHYYACRSCVGKTLEGTLLMSPCLRVLYDGYDFPNPCPKQARGVETGSIPKWEQISTDEFNRTWEVGKALNAKTRVLYDE